MTQKFELNVNGTHHTVHVEPDVPLLWVVRDYLRLTGSALRLDGAALASPATPVSAAVGKIISTSDHAAH